MTRLFVDSDLDPRTHMGIAIEAVEHVLSERASGHAVVQRRTRLDTGRNALALTPGALPGLGVGGLRVYPVRGSDPQQLIGVWDMTTGRLEALFLGFLLGILRTGAIGGVAVKALTPAPTQRVAVIGSGPQAFMQLVAVTTVRDVAQVTVHRRDRARVGETAEQWSESLHRDITPAASAREAARGADVVILATTATAPVIEPDWLEPNAYVASLGPKKHDATEIPHRLLERAPRLVSDFPEQYASDPDHIAYGMKVEDLAAAFVAGPAAERRATVFLSHGLAGTEVAVAHLLARRLIAEGRGRVIA